MTKRDCPIQQLPNGHDVGTFASSVRFVGSLSPVRPSHRKSNSHRKCHVSLKMRAASSERGKARQLLTELELHVRHQWRRESNCRPCLDRSSNERDILPRESREVPTQWNFRKPAREPQSRTLVLTFSDAEPVPSLGTNAARTLPDQSVCSPRPECLLASGRATAVEHSLIPSFVGDKCRPHPPRPECLLSQTRVSAFTVEHALIPSFVGDKCRPHPPRPECLLFQTRVSAFLWRLFLGIVQAICVPVT